MSTSSEPGKTGESSAADRRETAWESVMSDNDIIGRLCSVYNHNYTFTYMNQKVNSNYIFTEKILFTSMMALTLPILQLKRGRDQLTLVSFTNLADRMFTFVSHRTVQAP